MSNKRSVKRVVYAYKDSHRNYWTIAAELEVQCEDFADSGMVNWDVFVFRHPFLGSAELPRLLLKHEPLWRGTVQENDGFPLGIVAALGAMMGEFQGYALDFVAHGRKVVEKRSEEHTSELQSR